MPPIFHLASNQKIMAAECEDFLQLNSILKRLQEDAAAFRTSSGELKPQLKKGMHRQDIVGWPQKQQ